MRPILRHLFTAGLFLLALSVFGQPLTTTFAPATVNATLGSTVSLQLKVTNFTNITSVQFPITYNSAVLQFTSISNATLPGFTAANYNATTGKVTVSWYPDLGQYPSGFTIADNSTIFTVNFTVLANGSSAVNIANVSPGIEVTRNNNVIQVNFGTGGTQVTAGSGGPGPLTGFHVLANTIQIPQGQTGCMPVTVNDFDNIVSAAFATHWNTSVLQYQNTAAYNLPDLSASNFNPYGSGTLLMSWYDQTLNGVTRPDGSAIYQVCFKATGPVGSTSMVTIDGVGFPPGGGGAEVINAASQNVWQNDSGVSDTIFVITAPPPPNAVTFTADKDTVSTGGTTCVDVKVTNFTDVISMQLGMTYDATKIQFQSFQFGANPLGLSNANFNPNIPGEIKFTWFDPNAVGVDLANNTVIFSVCYTAVGGANMTSPFTFTSLPGFAVEIVKEPGGEVTPSLNNGSVFITNVVPPIVQVDSIAAVNCNGASTGAIFITAKNGTPTQYTWSGGMSGNPDDLMGVPANTYTVTVTFAGGATATATAQVTQPAALAVANPTVTNVDCFGAQSGAITVSPSGGTTPYSYAWAGPSYSQTTTIPTVTGLKGGLYTVTITDKAGCSKTTTASVSQPSADISVPGGQASVSNISCFGGGNGAITILNPSGGTPPYATYTWTGPAGYPGASTKSIANLSLPGNYNLVITDSKGCTKAIAPYTVTAPSAPLQASQSGASTDVTCPGANNGKATVTVTGGTPNYTIAWKLGNQTIANGLSPNNLVPGTYTVSVTDANSCTTTVSSITVGGPTEPLSIGTPTITHVKCPGEDNGCISITPGGGNGAPFTVSWSNTTQTTTQICNLSGGTYKPVVTDKNGCSYTFDDITVTEPNPIAFPDSNIVEQNGVNLGSISLGNFTGGTPSFTYNWTGPNNFTSTQKDLTGLPSGKYNLTITDGNGCIYLLDSIEVKNANVLVNTTATITPACNNDGCIHLTIPQGAPAPFIVKWSGGEQLSSSNQISVCNLASGAYSLTITDAGGNAHTISKVVTQLAPAYVGSSITEPFDESKNGKIVLTPIPAGTVLGYTWAHDPSLLSNVVSGLDSGTYVVTVTNPISGCTSVYSFTLKRTYKDLEVNTLQVVPANCLNTANGSINLEVKGGNDPYTFNWSGPNGFTASTQNISGLLPGVYAVTVTDQNDTLNIQSFTISPQSSLLVTNVNELSDYSGFQVSSTAACDGEAAVVFTGASGSTSILWSNGISGVNNFELCGGPYSVTVTDNLGCTSVWSDSLSVPPSVVSVFKVLTDFDGFGVPCNGSCIGKARVTVAGGIPPYTVKWPSGQTDQILTANGFAQAEQLCAGDYTITITDAFSATNGLNYTFTGTITEPAPLVIEFEDVTPQTLNSCDGQIIASAPAANGDATFIWSNKNTGANGDGPRVEDLCAGQFVEFIVEDEQGCIANATHQVPYPNCLDVRPIVTPGQQDGKNDYTLITCIEDFPNNTFELFNRWGQLVFQLRGYKNEPSLDNFRGTGNIGATNGRDLPEGAYFFVLKYTDDQGNDQTRKGYVNLLR